MKNSNKSIWFKGGGILLSIGLLTGCGSISTPKQNSHETLSDIKLVDDSVVGYAQVNKDGNLLKISIDYPASGTLDTENIRITSSGFYPDYNIKDQQCGRFYVKNRLTDFTEKAFCKSNYTSTKGGAVGTFNMAYNALFIPIGAIVNPLDTVSGKPLYSSIKSFNEKSFIEVVEKNKLTKFREKLLELKKNVDNKTTEIEKMYDHYFQQYSNNLFNIQFVYNIKDDSGLLPVKKLDGNCKLELNAPIRKKYSYDSILNSFNATSNNFDKEYTDTLNKVNYQFEEDKKQYRAYLETAFTSYKIQGGGDKIFKHNEHISFMSTIKTPDEIKYKLNEKISIPITIIVKSAKLTKMIPKKYVLSDLNIDSNFESNLDGTVSLIVRNKTNSFVSIKSLTSYFNNNVYNLADINREISPEATTLQMNSNYSLLSNEMLNSSNFTEITKTKAKAINITYGYAVKYRNNNTNVDKSIYNTKEYSLYSIFQQYL